jgi:5-methylcytosine-specific restriction endonuclease McrA
MIVNCKNCNSDIKTFPSKAWRTNFCSNDCKDSYKSKKIESRKKICQNCNSEFFPRRYQIDTGNAKYCSAKCRNESSLPSLLSKESKEKSKKTYKEKIASGEIKHPSGENHPRWRGGHKECLKRRIESGKANEAQKKYRANNSDKLREWKHSRKSVKHGRLPKNTVKNLLLQQKNKCALCKIDVSSGYHLDHIMPLSKGGLHAVGNVQILCPSCNLRKAAKLHYVPERIHCEENEI